MTTVRAGRLNHRIHLQRMQEGEPDAAGVSHPTWATYRTVWASVEPLAPSQPWNAEQAQGRATHTIGIRQGPDVRSDDRALMGDRVFHFEGPPRDLQERRRLVLLTAIEMPEASIEGSTR